MQPLAFVLGVAGLVGALVLGYLRGKAREARALMARLSAGELSARFPIGPADGVGQLMEAFNGMAAEIERLVGEVRRVDAARQRLLAELGHDLRTPLTALTNSVETLERHPQLAAEARQRCARIAVREARHVHGLIENLLLLSRTDAPDHALSRQRLDLAAFVHDEIESVQALRPDLSVAIESAADAALVGDADLLRRLVRNLLDNAIRHARTRVDVQLRGGPGRVDLTVEDDGPGLPDYLLDPTLAPPEGSRKGLGLVIVRRVLQLHAGSLSFAATGGGGARVVATLPRSPDPGA